jgi:hypothetical protein
MNLGRAGRMILIMRRISPADGDSCRSRDQLILDDLTGAESVINWLIHNSLVPTLAIWRSDYFLIREGRTRYSAFVVRSHQARQIWHSANPGIDQTPAGQDRFHHLIHSFNGLTPFCFIGIRRKDHPLINALLSSV